METVVNNKVQPAPLFIDDLAIVRIAIAKAGGLRALEAATGIARSTITRLQNGYTEKLWDKTKRILVDYIND